MSVMRALTLSDRLAVPSPAYWLVLLVEPAYRITVLTLIPAIMFYVSPGRHGEALLAGDFTSYGYSSQEH